MNAWATLLTQPSYLPGVRTLRASLEKSGSAYPLVVMVTDGIGAPNRQLLADEGCLLREAHDSGPPVGYWALMRDPDGHTLEVAHGQELGLVVDEAGHEAPRP